MFEREMSLSVETEVSCSEIPNINHFHPAKALS